MTKVSVLGLGAMGSALASTLLGAGHPVTVWNRSPEKARALVDGGARLARDANGAIAANDTLIVCVLDDAAARSVLFDQGADLRGKTIVNLTNGTPAQARAVAARVASAGGAYLDGGIMAIPPMVGGPHALVLYSGDRAAFDAHAGMLGTLGAAEYLGDDAGLASLHDLALLAAMYGLFAGALQAFAMVRSEKVATTRLLPLLQPWLAAMAESLPEMAQQIDAGDYTTGVVSNLAMQAIGMDNIAAASLEQGVSADLIEPMRQRMHRRVRDGFGGDDLAGLIELMGASAATPPRRRTA